MRLLQLKLGNFKQYRNLVIDFSDGLTGIVGSNGAGKSTIFDAVRCALFGEIPAGKDLLRSVDAGRSEPVSIELSFESGGKRYRAVREFRGAALAPQAKLYEEGYDECIAVQQGPVTARIESILGMSGDAFVHSVFSGQKELGRISETTGAERRGLVREMLGMSKIDEIQKLVREEYNERNGRIKALEEISKTPEEMERLRKEETAGSAEVNKLTQAIAAAAAKSDEASRVYAAADGVFSEQHKLFTVYDGHKRLRDKAAHAAEAALTLRSQRSSELEKLAAEKKILEEQSGVPARFAELSGRNESFISAMNIQAKRIEIEKHLESKRSEYSRLRKRRTELSKELDEIIPEIAKAENLRKRDSEMESELRATDDSIQKISTREGEILSKRDERVAHRKKISDLGQDADCPLCRRPLAGHYEEVLKNLSEEIARYENNELAGILAEKKRLLETKKLAQAERNRIAQEMKALSVLEGSVIQKRKELAETDSRLDITAKEGESLKKELESLGTEKYDAEAHKRLKAELDTASKENEEFVRRTERVARIPAIEKEIQALSEEHQKRTSESTAAERLMKGCGFSEAAHEKSINDRNAALQARNAAQSEKDALTEEHHRREKALQSVSSEIARDAESRKQIENLSSERDRYHRLVAIFDGFKNALLARVQPAIASSASELFSRMTGGRYGEIIVDDNFDFHINDGGNLYPIRRFSGGEIDLANLCLRVAISRSIRSLSGGGSSGFLGFDEIFGSQDAERRHTVMDALNRLSGEYNQIFIVSHVDDVKDEFPRIIEVTRGADGSAAAYR
jgi:exonuclease SbcC